MKAYFIIIIFALTDVRQAQSKWRSDQREEGEKNSAHTLMFMPSQRLSTSHDTEWKLKFGVRKRRHFFSFLLFLLKLLFSCVDLLFIWLSVLIEFSIICQWFFHPSSFSLPFFFCFTEMCTLLRSRNTLWFFTGQTCSLEQLQKVNILKSFHILHIAH